MPTEAEWEYAAAGGIENFLYPWGIDVPDNTRANSKACTDCANSPFVAVGSHRAGNARWGHADLAGSMNERLFDSFSPGYYGTMVSPTPCDNCANTSSATQRMSHGGGWADDALGLRAVYRREGVPASRSVTIGFRCARNL